MKWTIVLLVLLGVIAAFCAVALVNAIRVDDSVQAYKKGEVPVVVATTDLPAMSFVTADAVKIQTFKTKEVPPGSYTSLTQVIGKILSGPLVEGQVLTRGDLLTEGSGAKLAASLKPGMRAISVNLSSQSISGGLLYPGCVVDVLASFKLSGSASRDAKGEAISTTLLQNIQVLAVGSESVISASDADKEADKLKEKTQSASRSLTVTLLVDPRQAEALQLATLNGTISLAMRNPTDDQPVDFDATVLNSGKLSKLGALLGSTVNKQDSSGSQTSTAPTDPLGGWGDAEPSNWDVTVIRGSKVTEEEVKNDE